MDCQHPRHRYSCIDLFILAWCQPHKSLEIRRHSSCTTKYWCRFFTPSVIFHFNTSFTHFCCHEFIKKNFPSLHGSGSWNTTQFPCLHVTETHAMLFSDQICLIYDSIIFFAISSDLDCFITGSDFGNISVTRYSYHVLSLWFIWCYVLCGSPARRHGSYRHYIRWRYLSYFNTAQGNVTAIR